MIRLLRRQSTAVRPWYNSLSKTENLFNHPPKVQSFHSIMIILRKTFSSSPTQTNEEEGVGNFTRRLSDSWDNNELQTLSHYTRPVQGETLDLILRQKLYLLQSRRGYRANIDSHILAYFASLLYNGSKSQDDGKSLRVLDLGAGNGLVSILFAKANLPCYVHMVELQPQLAQRAARNLILNDLQGNVTQHDLQSGLLPKALHARFDIILINPPYYPYGSRTPPKRREKLLAHMETSASISDFLRAAYTACDLHNPDAFVAVIHDRKELPRLINAARFNNFALCESREMIHDPGAEPSRIMLQLKPRRKRPETNDRSTKSNMDPQKIQPDHSSWVSRIPTLPPLILHPSRYEQTSYTSEIEEYLERLPLPSLRIGRLRDVDVEL